MKTNIGKNQFLTNNKKKIEDVKIDSWNYVGNAMNWNLEKAKEYIVELESKRDPNKVEMMENIIWTFLKSEANAYKREETECINKEDGVFQSYLKQCTTIMKRIAEEEEAKIDKIYRRGYTAQKSAEFQTQFISIYLKRAIQDGQEESKTLEIDYVISKLGHHGCNMFKSYVAMKAAELYIQDKFKKKTEAMKKFITQFRKLESYWEKNIMI